MIDRDSRNCYAEQLRHFAAGVSTVEDYEKRTDNLRSEGGTGTDAAVYSIRSIVWLFYDDFRTERLRGDWELSKESKRRFAESILFLYSDCEYQWPEFRPSAKSRLFDVMDDMVDPLLFLPDLLTAKRFRLQERWRQLTEPFRERQWEARQQFMR